MSMKFALVENIYFNFFHNSFLPLRQERTGLNRLNWGGGEKIGVEQESSLGGLRKSLAIAIIWRG